jgi:transcriptional regulator with XRE-family HTH domain
MSVFGERFKELLELKKISQSAIAQKLGVAQKTISNWCIGRNEPNYDMLLTICKELGETPNYMVGYEN